MTQAEALAILKTGANVFLTGEPGSGKSHTINQYVSYLRSCGIEPAITASTGIAATHIGGMTIHSWSGIGIRQTLTEYDLDTISQNERIVRRLSRARILIIDEVSMLSAQTLSMVDQVCRLIKRSMNPFGGLQVVLVGDFFQLPPVVKNQEYQQKDDSQLIFEDQEEDLRHQFAFRVPFWDSAKFIVCYLHEQYRQEDAAFLEILGAIRSGTVSQKHTALLAQRFIEKESDVLRDVTMLFSHNTDVDRINSKELALLSGEEKVFTMESEGFSVVIDQLKKTCLSPEVLKLKKGAKVLFTKNNVEQGFVNGTLGEVIDFRDYDTIPIVRVRDGRIIEADTMEWAVEVDGRVVASVSQVPLRLAWAITVHKSQGMSLDMAVIDLSLAFEYGQGYVALSRVRTLSGLHLLGLNKQALLVHPDIQIKDGEFKEASREAQQAFALLSLGELSDMHKNFVTACGGDSSVLSAHAQSSATRKSRRLQKKTKDATLDETLALLQAKKTVKEIAKHRGLKEATILDHLEKLQKADRLKETDIVHMKKELHSTKQIWSVFDLVGVELLRPVFDALGGKISFETIHLARIVYRGEKR